MGRTPAAEKKPWSLFLWTLSFGRISAVKFDSQSSSNKLPSVMTADTLSMCLVQFQEENRTPVVTK